MSVLKRYAMTVVAWFGGFEPAVLLACLVVAAGAWAFIGTAEEMAEGETGRFDVWVVKSLRRPGQPDRTIGPDWLAEVGRDVTAFGGVAALTFFTAAVAGFLWLVGKRRMLAFLLAATASGLLLSSLLKALFHRPRPDVVPHLAYVYTTSFPSGHSLLATVVYLTLGTLLASSVQGRAVKVYVVALALLLSAAVGVSRVFLGVHYPTDVLAGWAAGLAWALLCWLVARRLQRRGKLEPEGTDPDGTPDGPADPNRG